MTKTLEERITSICTDLLEASSHFIEVANWLDAQADAYNPLEACDDE